MLTRVSEDLMYYNQLVKLISEFEESDEFKQLLDYAIENGKEFKTRLIEGNLYPGSNYEPDAKIITFNGVIQHKCYMRTGFDSKTEELYDFFPFVTHAIKILSSRDLDKYYDKMLDDFKTTVKRVLLYLKDKQEVKNED